MVARTIDYVQPGVLHGIEPGLGRQPLSEVERGILAGDYYLGPDVREPGALPYVLLGRQLAASLATLPGDTLLIGTIENLNVGPLGDLQPELRQFVIAGTVSTGMYEYDNVHLYARLADVQDLLDLPDDTIGYLAVNIDDAWNASETAVRVRDASGTRTTWTTGWTCTARSSLRCASRSWPWPSSCH
jgi:ABC-type lipoprotein release transport system permease subunit